MNRRIIICVLAAFVTVLYPYTAPAPLIYRPGEGWTYEMPGSKGSWHRDRAKDQLELGQKAFDEKNYSLALKCSKRVVSVWPLSDYAPQAQYLVGRCYEAKKRDEKAFKAYQQIMEKYPKISIYQEIQQREFDIATRFLKGQRFKLFGYIPTFPSMEKTAHMYEKIVKNGPYSEIAPRAQINIGAAREKQKEFGMAAKAYETAADRYNEQREVAAEATFKAGMAYKKESRTGEYDQNISGQAVATLGDFITLYPENSRVPEAQTAIQTLRAEQARGNFRIAHFYEKTRILPKQARIDGALIYYNEVLLKTPESPLADEARRRMEILKKQKQP
jgi:outer membrane protein assembly factor BamD (BamD/ComL family)